MPSGAHSIPCVRRPPSDGARKRRSTVISLPLDCAAAMARVAARIAMRPECSRVRTERAGACARRAGHACLLRQTRHSISDVRIAEWLGDRMRALERLVGALRRGDSSDRRGFCRGACVASINAPMVTASARASSEPSRSSVSGPRRSPGPKHPQLISRPAM